MEPGETTSSCTWRMKSKIFLKSAFDYSSWASRRTTREHEFFGQDLLNLQRGKKGGGRNGKYRLSLVRRNDQLCWEGTRKTLSSECWTPVASTASAFRGMGKDGGCISHLYLLWFSSNNTHFSYICLAWTSLLHKTFESLNNFIQFRYIYICVPYINAYIEIHICDLWVK